MVNRKKARVILKECVACGCCVKVCPMSAISVNKGVYATIDNELCVGCGKCQMACPASVIVMEEVSEE